MSISPAEKQAFAVKSFQSNTDKQNLAAVFGPSNAKTQTWKTKPNQCVMGLHDPSHHAETTEGIPEQFMKDGGINVLLNMLLDLSL
jgi:hypothetical protein